MANAANLAVLHLVSASAASALFVGGGFAAAYALQKPVPEWTLLFSMGVSLYLTSVGLHYAALAMEASRAAERRTAEARELAREAELLSLRIQLNPHFLFNSLHSIAALSMLDAARAREMCVQLADFLRSSIALGRRESIPLREELAMARSYLDVERVRFGKRLRLEERVDDSCLECPIPALLLQPLVENAVKHGIAGMLEGGAIRISAERTGSTLEISIENAVDPDSVSNLGVGHSHVRRRLDVRYGGAAVFDAGPAEGAYRVVLRFPCESPIASSSRA